jgi:hypothetical protein
MAELRRLVPGGAGGEKPLICHNPQALSNVQEENLSCARDPLRHRGKAGWWLFRMMRLRIWENIELSVGFGGCCE